MKGLEFYIFAYQKRDLCQFIIERLFRKVAYSNTTVSQVINKINRSRVRLRKLVNIALDSVLELGGIQFQYRLR